MQHNKLNLSVKIFLCLAMSFSLHGTIVYQVILEKKISPDRVHRALFFAEEYSAKNKRTDLTHIIHNQTEAIAALMQKLGARSQKAELYLEAALDKDFLLDAQLTKYVQDGDSLQTPSADEVIVSRRDVNKFFIKTVMKGIEQANSGEWKLSYEEQLLYALGKKFHSSPEAQFLDTRSFFSTLVNLIDRVHRASLMRDFPQGRHYLDYLTALDLTVGQVFSCVDEMMQRAHMRIQELSAITKNLTMSYLSAMAQELSNLMGEMRNSRAYFGNDTDLFFKQLLDLTKKALPRMKPEDDGADYFAATHSLGFMVLSQNIRKTLSNDNQLDIFDIEILANMLKTSAITTVSVLGRAHVDRLQNALQQEGYKVIYRSLPKVMGFEVSGDREKDAMNLMNIAFSNPGRLDELTEYIKTGNKALSDPMDESEFEYGLLDKKALKALKQVGGTLDK